MSEMADRVAQLSEGIRHSHPSASVDLRRYPSGAVMLDVRQSDRLFVLAWSPSTGFGVDEVTEEDAAFDSGYRFYSEHYDDAARELLRLISEGSS